MTLAQSREIRFRVEQFRQTFHREEIDAALLLKRADITYFTGQSVHYSALLVTARRIVHLVHATDYEFARLRSFREIELFPFSGLLEDCLQEWFTQLAFTRCGFDPLDMNVQLFEHLEQAGHLDRMISKPALTSAIREIKSKSEIKALVRCAEMTYRLIECLVADARETNTEKWLVDRLIQRAASLKCIPAFNPIVCSGTNSSMPHAQPGDDKIGRGVLTIIDFGLIHQNYCSDIALTFTIGRPSVLKRKVVRNIWSVLTGAISRFRTGDSIGDLGAWIHTEIDQRIGRDAYITPPGHGIGIELHESPFIHSNSNKKLLEGMVFCLEPGVYIPGWGGARFEMPVLVNRFGLDPLVRLPSQD